MTDLTTAVETHCELYNECARTGNWEPFTATLSDDALMTFREAHHGPFIGREQIAVAYAQQPFRQTVTLEAVETLDPQTARVHFVWDATGADDMMIVHWRHGMVSEIELTECASTIFR